MLYIFLFAFTIVIFLLFTQMIQNVQSYKEDFYLEKKDYTNIILLGDSILDNHLYVPKGKTVEDFLQRSLDNPYIKIYNFAEDNSTIEDVLNNQVKLIPDILNSSSTIIFLSIGGNDIINKFIIHSKMRNDDPTFVLQTLFIKYKNLLDTIHQKLKKTSLVLLDIYYPTNPLFHKYIPVLQKWNELLEKNITTNRIIPISKNVRESSDFTNNIEPSEKGGEKIAKSIFQELK